LELIRLDGAFLDALVRDPRAAFRGPWSNGPIVAGYLPAIASQTRTLYDKGDFVFPFIGYLARREDDQALVGTCAFATPPAEGEAEIAYYTFPQYEHSGVGTAMARALVEIARDAGLDAVTAKTLPLENASTHILRRLAFDLEGPDIDEQDGEVWRWRLTL
jgi:RimJ/RimL family protein N-acetyltransferase